MMTLSHHIGQSKNVCMGHRESLDRTEPQGGLVAMIDYHRHQCIGRDICMNRIAQSHGMKVIIQHTVV